MKKMIFLWGFFECVNVSAIDVVCGHVMIDDVKCRNLEDLEVNTSVAQQNAQENSDADTASVEALIVEAIENPDALEKLIRLGCESGLEDAINLWGISCNVSDYDPRKELEFNKVVAVIYNIAGDWCCGQAGEPAEYLARYYNGWYEPFASDEDAAFS